MSTPATALDRLARELGIVAGRIERENSLRLDAAISDLRRIGAEWELRLANLERSVTDGLARIAAIREPRDGDPGAPGTSVTVEDVAPIIAREVDRAVAALPKAKDGAPGRSITAEDVAPLIAVEVGRAVAALPPAEPGAPGAPVDPETVRSMVEGHVAAAFATVRVPKDGDPGKSVEPAEVRAMVEEAVVAAVRALPPPKDGDSVTVEDLTPVVVEEVAKAVAALPAPAPGRSITPADVAPMIEERIAAAVAALPPAPKGDPGPPGKLPPARAWTDAVHYERDVVIHAGATYQAVRDTGRAPPHEDWVCLAAAGQPGKDGASFTVRSTWSAAEAYRHLDVVAFDGGAYVARRDGPGPCPGEGWQMLSMRGKAGRPGDPGRGIKGDPGKSVVAMDIDGQGMLTVTNGDGSVVTCDLYPVLSKLR